MTSMPKEFVVTTQSGKQLTLMALDKTHALIIAAELFVDEIPKQASLTTEW
jgi:hypothetical protein